MLPLQTRSLRLSEREVLTDPHGPLVEAVRAHLRGEGPGGLVILGAFGSGKTSLCRALAETPLNGERPATVVPLAVLARSPSIEEGLLRNVGARRLQEALEGRRVLLLDGLDEVPDPGSYEAWFRDLVAQVGPRWVLTSRPGHFRTAFEADPEQVDSLSMEGVLTVQIEPLGRQTVQEVIGGLPRGQALLRTVEGLEDLGSSPLLMHIILAALPHIEPGRPIDAWGIFDAWLRFSLRTGAQHDDVLARLEALAWEAFRDSGYAPVTSRFHRDALAQARIPPELRRNLMVTELDGRVRFGHRSVFEYLLAAHMTPRLAANQGQGPDELTGLQLTDATRAFLVGRVGRMPVRLDSERALIPRGNFVAGGTLSPDERMLRIAHVAEPFWISRAPVTGRQWQAWLDAVPDARQDANYLPHWGIDRRLPRGHDELPVFSIWPDDADRHAASVGARLPSADEWEKAVRGLDGRNWPWGDHWRRGMAITSELHVPLPLPVRAFGAHGDARLFGAVGGVFEITSTWWRGNPDRGRVVMGGCYTHSHEAARPSLRLSHRLSGNLKAGMRLAWNA